MDQAATPRRRVLLIEDDPSVREAVSLLVARFHEVITARDVGEALEQLQSRDDFDAVLCDVGLPDLNGVAACALFARRFPGLQGRLALVTGGAADAASHDVIMGSGLPVLIKPCRLNEILDLVERLARGASPTPS